MELETHLYFGNRLKKIDSGELDKHRDAGRRQPNALQSAEISPESA